MGVRAGVAAVGVMLVVTSSCSSGSDQTAVMRSVPTVPSPESAPSVATTPGPIDPNAPIVTVVPPSTALVGDPQPVPNATIPVPPIAPEGGPLPDSCTRLEPFGVEQIVADRSGQPAASEVLASGACRFRSGDVVVEVAFIPVAEFRDDWARREGIEPVGDVSGDAVGLASFQTPSGETGAGYTLAVAGGGEGVVVAVAAPSDARVLAADVAVFAQQAG
jgi:hypothetical protein